MQKQTILNELHEKYGLTVKNVAKLLGTNESTLKKELSEESKIGKEIYDSINSPDKVLKLVETSGFTTVSTAYNRIRNRIIQQKDIEYGRIVNGKVFVKQVRKNELGFRADGEIGAGSFVLMPKKSADEFFSDVTANLKERTWNNDEYVPSESIHVVYHSKNESIIRKKEQDITFTYQNGKRVKKMITSDNHDEYRLYKIRSGVDISPDDLIIMLEIPGEERKYDVVVLDKDDKSAKAILLMVDERKTSSARAAVIPIYELMRNGIVLPDIEWERYIVDTNADEEESVCNESYYNDQDNGINPYEGYSINKLLEKALMNDDVITASRMVKVIVRDSKFRKTILDQYGNRCAVTGHSLIYGDKACLQGCHIVPKSMGGGDNPKNGICLEYNMHWLFDNGFFTITPDYRIKVHDKVRNNKEFEYLNQFDGSLIHLPTDRRVWPDESHLIRHSNEIFGLFCK